MNGIPTKISCNELDYLILCFPGLDDRIRICATELVTFVSENKNKYRFTIYTNCEKGYTFNGITLSPYWKWRTSNKYHNCLVYADPSHLKLGINANTIL